MPTLTVLTLVLKLLVNSFTKVRKRLEKEEGDIFAFDMNWIPIIAFPAFSSDIPFGRSSRDKAFVISCALWKSTTQSSLLLKRPLVINTRSILRHLISGPGGWDDVKSESLK
jgi:hypothetical protein